MGGTMKVIDDGSWADLLTPEHFVRMILNAVQTAWKTLSRPEESSHENPVTNRLCAALKVGSANANLPFHVDPQSTFLDEGGRVTGIPDIRFTPNVTRTGDDFYVVECKRLRFSYRGKCRSGNGDYIDGQGEGMTAFIDERYPAPHGYGAMVGYIFCSCTDPVGSVRGAISGRFCSHLWVELGFSRPSMISLWAESLLFSMSSSMPMNARAEAQVKRRGPSSAVQLLVLNPCSGYRK